MIHRVDTRLRDEARHYHLLFACPDCVFHDADGDRCALGFPNEMHKDAGLEHRAEIVFCKAFEIS